VSAPAVRILVAGIGNIFLGDDGFGVEAARLLAARPMPAGVVVADFGIRGLDLAYALLEPYDAVIFVDLAARGGAPGTLYLIEAAQSPAPTAALDAHGMDPLKVLALARSLGAQPTRTFVVACEPAFLPAADSEEIVMELSEPVRAALGEAARMVEELIDSIVTGSEVDRAKSLA